MELAAALFGTPSLYTSFGELLLRVWLTATAIIAGVSFLIVGLGYWFGARTGWGANKCGLGALLLVVTIMSGVGCIRSHADRYASNIERERSRIAVTSFGIATVGIALTPKRWMGHRDDSTDEAQNGDA